LPVAAVIATTHVIAVPTMAKTNRSQLDYGQTNGQDENE